MHPVTAVAPSACFPCLHVADGRHPRIPLEVSVGPGLDSGRGTKHPAGVFGRYACEGQGFAGAKSGFPGEAPTGKQAKRALLSRRDGHTVLTVLLPVVGGRWSEGGGPREQREGGLGQGGWMGRGHLGGGEGRGRFAPANGHLFSSLNSWLGERAAGQEMLMSRSRVNPKPVVKHLGAVPLIHRISSATGASSPFGHPF